MTATPTTVPPPRHHCAWLHSRLGIRRSPAVIERNVMVYRHAGRLRLRLPRAGVLPVLARHRLGKLIGSVPLGDGDGVSYAAFVAPAMLASSAMNGAVIDATFNVFFKLKYNKLYDACSATPVDTASTSRSARSSGRSMRGRIYSAGFLVVMLALGLVSCPGGRCSCCRRAVLIGFAFAAAGMAATTYMRSWQDFEWIDAGDAAAVPAVGDVLPAVDLPAGSSRRALDAALPGRRPRPLADDRGGARRGC